MLFLELNFLYIKPRHRISSEFAVCMSITTPDRENIESYCIIIDLEYQLNKKDP